jgi:methanogenic corrinoid protein MtbC1
MRSSPDTDTQEPGGSHGSHGSAPQRWAGRPKLPASKEPLVRALQRELIPRLARAYRPSLARLTAQDVDTFTQDLLQGGERSLTARLESFRQRGFGSEVLCLDLLAPSARRLGELWNDDRCDFASVTIGVSQLQRLMRLLGTGWAPGGQGAGLRVLLMQPPQEQHSFGLAMVAEFFRAAGWGVAGGVGDMAVTAAARTQAHHFDAVGFSVGGETQLEWLAQQIAAVRLASRNPQIVVMVGGPLFVLQPHWARDLGADLCVPSAQEAPGRAEQLVRAGQLA